MGTYQQDQARDDHGRWTSGGQGPSQRRGEIVRLNQRLDARRYGVTRDFGPAARYVENKPAPAHGAAIAKATGGKTLAQLSAAGTNPAMPPPKIGGQS